MKICERSTRPESFPRLYRCKTFKPKGSVTFTDDKGEPWFVTKDVCGVLGFDHTPSAIRSLDDDERSYVRIVYSSATVGNPKVSIIKESGLYSLIMRSP